MGIKKGLVKGMRNFADWIENDSSLQNFNHCVACDLMTVASNILKDAQVKIDAIIADAETKMSQDVTLVCSKCTQTAPPAPSSNPTTPGVAKK